MHLHTRALSLAVALAALPFAPSSNAQEFLVSSRFTDQVLRYDAQGTFLGAFASSGGLDNPVGITFGPDGLLYVASGDTREVLRYDGRTGSFLGVFASGGGLDGVRHLGFGPDGDLYVCSGASDQVLRYDGRNGVFGGIAAQHALLDGPTSMVFGADGLLYVVGVLSQRILRFEPRTGAYLGVFAQASLATPHDAVFGPDGDLYVTNVGDPTRSIVQLDGRTGALRRVLVRDASLVAPLGLVFGRDGVLYVCNQGGDDVRRYDGQSGALLPSAVLPRAGGLDGPMFLAFVPPSTGPRVLAPMPPNASSVTMVGAHGLQPGAFVALLAGTQAGTPLPTCGGIALGVLDPLLLSLAPADESGTLLFRAFVPAELGGITLQFQALDLPGCRVTPVLPHTFL